MDINNSYQSNSDLSPRTSSGGSFGYDVEVERQRIAEGTVAVKKELLEKWKKEYKDAQIFPTPISSMRPDIVDFLLSFNLVSVYDSIAKQASIDAKGRNVLPRVVWQIAQSKNWDSLDQILEANLPLVHSAHVAVVDLLKQNILNKIQALSENQTAQKTTIVEKQPKKEIQLPLSQALSQFPKIGEQTVGGSQIKIRAFATPVRASIKNWIVDFHDAMGSGKHSPIDRGNFLFHSENGKKLTPTERQNVALVLKSLEDGTPLTIDVEAQIIIFGNSEESTENKQPSLNEKENSQSFAKEEMVENFFQIPESKPPIGSDEFHVEIPENKIGNNEPINNSYSEKVKDESLLKKFREKSFGFMKSDSVGANNETTDQETQNSQKNFSPNFAANDGKISFSSAQKLPVEQGVASATSSPQVSQVQQQEPVQQARQFSEIEQIPQAKKPQQESMSPYRIIPSSYAQQRNDVEPKVQGNVVDLKN